MAVAELHFFAADDLNGATIYECTTDDPWVQQIEIEPSLSHLGFGKVKFARRVGESMIASGIISAGVLVRVLIPAISTTRYLWGFFINARSQRVVDKDEKGGEYFEFGGPGPKYYLTNAILWETEYGDGAGIPDQDAGVWTWQGTARPGAILNRLILEDVAHATNFLPDLTKSFSNTDDSNSVAWSTDVTVGDDFTLNMGSNYLELLWVLENIGNLETDFNLGTVAAPLMQLDAYQTFGRDLTGAQAADTVHFTEGVNILSELEVGGDTLLRASHALVRGAEGTWKHAIRTSWSPGDPVRAIGYDFTVSSYEPTLEAAGKRFLRAHDVDGEVDLNMQPGWAPADGLYMPGPEGTNGHFWYGDTVSLTTGMGSPSVLDYSADDKRVMAVNMKLAEAVDDSDATSRAVSWLINVKFDKERTSNATAPSGAGGGGGDGTHSNCTCIRLCRTSVAGDTPTVLADIGNGVNGDDHLLLASLVPAGAGGLIFVCMFQEDDTLTSVVYEPQGAAVPGLHQTMTLIGTATNPATAPSTPETAIAVYWLASPTQANASGRIKFLGPGGGFGLGAWVTDSDETPSAVFAVGTGQIAAVNAGAAGSADLILTAAGWRRWSLSNISQTPNDLSGQTEDWTIAHNAPTGQADVTWGGGHAVGGATYQWDLITVQNWVATAVYQTGSGGSEGDQPQPIARVGSVGTSGRAVRCDVVFPMGYLSTDGEHYLDAADIEFQPTGTITATDVQGALAQVGVTPTLRWEAVTNGEDVFVWEGDDLVHEWKEY